jgi:hypothetical protein
MILIDIDQTVSLVFTGDYHTKTGSTYLKLTDKSKNTYHSYPLTSAITYTLRYTEFSISGFTSQLEAGQYYYELIVDDTTVDNGICKVIGTNVVIPIYLDDMAQYVIYKN